MININQKVPNVTVKYVTNNEISEINFYDYLADKKAVIFGLPGAFTPTCSGSHLPSFAETVENFKQKGVDQVICLAVNDVFVLKAWAQHHKVEHKINFISDGNGSLTQALGLTLDATPFGMGIRSQRYSMYVESGVVRLLNIETSSGACTVAAAPTILGQIL
ncbi:peroxiredoxin [Candidatus Paracaedibacter symbiosus]|uniref:peroxiredoxin n=1 Tax=Candidatus Paracaedibacter symbiosus TaxID=244582 RepID=UPI00050973D7|nr:peroxiredoxin [Candidatus Paracaedibacter symbiosus]